jgi:hypothetical protein
MGARRRVRQTAKRPAGRDVLDRFAVKRPATWHEVKRREGREKRERHEDHQ